MFIKAMDTHAKKNVEDRQNKCMQSKSIIDVKLGITGGMADEHKDDPKSREGSKQT